MKICKISPPCFMVVSPPSRTPKTKMTEDNSAAKEPAAEPVQKPSEEMKYPNRQLELIRLSPMSRAAGISDHKFISSFRASPYHFNTKLTNQQEKVLSPSRHELLAHLLAQAPGFSLPSILLNSKDRIKSLEEVAGKKLEAVDEILVIVIQVGQGLDHVAGL